MLALLLSLGRWQLNRADEKQARQALYDARIAESPVVLTGAVASADPLLYRRLRASGRWLAQKQIYIDNRIQAGRAGFHVITPLQLDSGAAVLVNRGWITRDARYPKAPPIPVPAGRVEASGLAVRPPERFRELSSEVVAGNVWQNLSIERYAAHSGLALLPVVILSDRPAPGLAPVVEKPDAGVAKHHEYALTWYALALTTLALWLGLNLRRVA